MDLRRAAGWLFVVAGALGILLTLVYVAMSGRALGIVLGMVCPRCDWQGLPVSFGSGDSYAAFTRDLNERRSAA